MILAVTGHSGVGKTTLIRNLRKMLPFEVLKSVTTREPRESDIGEFEYLAPEIFDRLAAQNEFLWTANPYGHWYGTRASEVDAALQSGHWYGAALVIPAIAILVEHAATLHLETRVLPIYLTLSDDVEMRRRLVERGEEEIELRMSESKTWEQQARDSGVNFTYIDTARGPLEIAEEVRAIMRKHADSIPVSRLIS